MSDPTDRADRFTWRKGDIVWTKPPAGLDPTAGDPADPPVAPRDGSCDEGGRTADTTPPLRSFRHPTPEN